jgi:hypothetical protein
LKNSFSKNKKRLIGYMQKLNRKLLKESNKTYKYAVILGSDPEIIVYGIDLNQFLLGTSYQSELSIQKTGGKNAAGGLQSFAQLNGTFFYDGTENSALSIADMITTLGVDAAVYIGAKERFNTLYDKRTDLKWIVGDGNYAYEDFEYGNVRMMGFGGGDPENIAHDLGYDAARFLETVIESLPDSYLERDKLLEEAKITEYQGRTGEKGFLVNENGWYDVFKATTGGWELIQHPRQEDEIIAPPLVEGTVPVYRFYSEQLKRHFFTRDTNEKNTIIATSPIDVWRYEGITYYAYP